MTERKGYTSIQFQRAREALLACNDADRAYLRRWILRWVDDYGRISRESEKLPEKGCRVKDPSTFGERFQEQLDDPRKKHRWQVGLYAGIASTVGVPIALFGLLDTGRLLVKQGTWSMSDYLERAVPLLVIGCLIFTLNAAFGILSYRQLKRLGEFGAKK